MLEPKQVRYNAVSPITRRRAPVSIERLHQMQCSSTVVSVQLQRCLNKWQHITSDSDESCYSLTLSDRPLWIQIGGIEVNSELAAQRH
ncbi:hypothetical protein UY3_04636 [Chelonia mydas]|uniref:Uncharacterized protein n=1 Tax=Chelonia mydas TaxID=8469 RepID=M7BJP8_CHEMY|nr:hypothetical protein UY3_04636 [Chelonia mydas]